MIATILFLALAGQLHAYPVSGIAMSFDPIVRRYSDAYLVPFWLCMSTAMAESSFRPTAQSKGRHGALSRGLFQVNRKHQAELAAKAGVKHFDWRNPDHSAHVGIAYLSRLINKYHGDLRLAVASYNFGPGNVDRSLDLVRVAELKNLEDRPPGWQPNPFDPVAYPSDFWPIETRNYVRSVLG
jgi:soluble lytic murein transglycosylase-like protein